MARWTKGQSGNPRGRPRTGTAIAELARGQVDKHKLIAKLGSIAAGEQADVDVGQQLRAIQLLMSYAYGPPRTEIERNEGLKIQVIYAQRNHIEINGAAPGTTARHRGIEAVQPSLLRSPLGQDGARDGSPDSSCPAG